MIALNVDGREVRVDVDPTTPLLWVLRDNVGLTGTEIDFLKLSAGIFTIPASLGSRLQRSLPEQY
jgi:isoquinoline 1-oxidoreductase subunit alpha